MIRHTGLAALLASTLLGAPVIAQTLPGHTPPNPPLMEGGFATTDATDPYIWLEEVEGERAMAWVEAQNTRSLGILQGDPRYQGLHDEALALVEARDRIAMPSFNRDGTVDNFWQDGTHVRGLWRRTTLDSYRTEAPAWETILDVDALAASEEANWVYKGTTCLEPDERLCLVSLSDGGKDAVVVREFDSTTRTFVDGGFSLPEGKHRIDWIDADTLMVATDFGPGTLTESGYPFIVRILKRGQGLDQAVEVYRGTATDGGYGVSPTILRDADGAIQALLINRPLDTYRAETWRVVDGQAVKLALPERGRINALVQGQVVVTTDQDWTAPSGQAFTAGDVFAWDLDTWLADPAAPAQLIIRPGERDSIEGIGATRNRLIVARYENVRGGVDVYTPGSGDWARQRLDLPQNVTVGVGSASDTDDRIFVTAAGYLTPSSLYLADAASGTVEPLKALPAKFDAGGMTVDQFEARSADGTMVPYFVVHSDAMPMDGSNPTLLYGYGGFQVSMLPGYSPTTGKLWLERGGVYVVANTRGGGEFGPRWHQAAQQANRQRAHEDFQAVAADLIARGITSQPRLGIMGGSQGGLFMGAMLTQRPDLINAAVIQVPLFDMLRFHTLLAGASWMGEYGDPRIPEQRAVIAEYSPYQNLRADQPYPEVFIHTSTKDDRVHPGHARKAAARLEELGYPVLFYENTDGGHAAGANLRETARRIALEYTYLTRRLMD
jgi:prolyl oligopeptidase